MEPRPTMQNDVGRVFIPAILRSIGIMSESQTLPFDLSYGTMKMVRLIDMGRMGARTRTTNSRLPRWGEPACLFSGRVGFPPT
jgi:hypothetical protein